MTRFLDTSVRPTVRPRIAFLDPCIRTMMVATGEAEFSEVLIYWYYPETRNLRRFM